MTAALASRGKRALIFDVDAAQYGDAGAPCSLCGVRQVPAVLLSFVRVRQKLGDHSKELAWLCPDCVARAMIQVERCGLWRQLSAAVATAVKRVLTRKAERQGVAVDKKGTRR